MIDNTNKKNKRVKLTIILSIIFILIILIFLFLAYGCYKDLAEVILNVSGKKESIYFRVKEFQNQIHYGSRGFATPHTITIYDRNRVVIASLKDKDYQFISIQQVPVFLIDLLLIKEDMTFFTHKGIVPRRIFVSLLKNIRYGRNAFGGSTITQQVSKLLFTDQKKTVTRKVKEIITAFYIEKILTKEEILEIYINIAYFGYGRYGVSKASEFYFNKKVQQLNFAEAAMLVSIISSPERFSPLKNKDITKEKFKVLMNRAKKVEYIDAKTADNLSQNYVDTYDFTKLGVSSYLQIEDKSPWVQSYILSWINSNYSIKQAFESDFEIYTTTDSYAQFALQDSANYYVSQIIPSRVNDPADENNLEIASVSVNPLTGEILSFIGGKKYSPLNEFNRAFSSRRQVGSIIKPVLYLYAFLNNIVNPLTVVEDKPLSIETSTGKWEPKNYGQQYNGPIPIFRALQKSLNSVMVQVAMKMDLNDFLDWFNNVFPFIDKKSQEALKPYPSIALGSFEFSLLDIASIYCPIANLGTSVKPYLIEKVMSHGNIIYQNNIEKIYDSIDKTLDLELIYLLGLTSADGGTSNFAKRQTGFSYPVYSKTGTTNNGKDSWFVGFTDGLLTVVWTGYEKDTGKTALTGGGFSAYLYYIYTQKIYPFFAEDYKFVDENGSIVPICETTLLKANENCPKIYLFLPYIHQPSEYCASH